MIREVDLRVLPNVAVDSGRLAAVVAKEMAIDVRTITTVRILRRAIDARQRVIYVNLRVRVYINEEPGPLYEPVDYGDVSAGQRVIIVGSGPAGLFAALRSIELGLRPIVLERGKEVHSRRRDCAQISKNLVNAESNYCFGEGGAGAFSDGKLYTRSKKRGSVEKILRVLCQHGATESILIDAHPHIGTDRLPRVIESIRGTILRCGGEMHFDTKMVRLIIDHGECVGCVAYNSVLGREEAYYGPVILATGHSARDVYRYLHTSAITLESKGIAIGVRVEHPRELIDAMQYHRREGRGKYLPSAEYSFNCQVEGRGVYSFCMCPGGVIIPATTAKDLLVVNGMSPSHRSSPWSNAGIVVELRCDDIPAILPEHDRDYAPGHPLAMMHLQEALEHKLWRDSGRSQRAPAQRLTDFVNGVTSYALPRGSYAPGMVSMPMNSLLPPFISGRLRQAMTVFGNRSKGFLTAEAVVIGLESRTSAPVRIPRDDLSLQHIHLPGLFPCGEGSGYAGGIVSSAIDGERAAHAVWQALDTPHPR